MMKSKTYTSNLFLKSFSFDLVLFQICKYIYIYIQNQRSLFLLHEGHVARRKKFCQNKEEHWAGPWTVTSLHPPKPFLPNPWLKQPI